MKIFTTFLCLLTSALVQAQTYAKLRIDVGNANGGPVSAIFKDVKFIPLETTRESLFGRIEHLIVTGDNFIVYDNTTNQVLIFTKQGKYVSKINDLPGAKHTQGLGFFEKVLFDYAHNEIIVIPPSYQEAIRNKIFHFNLAGKLVKTEPFNNTLYWDAELLNGYYLLKKAKPGNIKESQDQQYDYSLATDGVTSKKDILKHDTLFYLPPEDRLNGGDLTLNHDKGKSFVIASSEYYDNAFYKIDTSGVTDAYRFIFPASMTVPADFMRDKHFDGRRQDFLKDHPRMVYSIQNIYINEHWLSFKFYNYDRKDSYILYSLKTGMPYSFERILPDPLSYNLPIFDNWPLIPVAYDQKIYTSVSSLNLTLAYKNGLNSSRAVNGEGLTMMKKMTRQQNPAIIELTPKDNL
ncbi:6-bladed beta-propeller [Mucilaginibacter sp.]|uniref:6-bladed beta-propeller n=1 Tax=Mucilaginibacter sp. TaxID=1882438 RepID=UPI002ED4CAEA